MAKTGKDVNRRGFLKGAVAGAAAGAATFVAPTLGSASAGALEPAHGDAKELLPITPEQAARALATETDPLPPEEQVSSLTTPALISWLT